MATEAFVPYSGPIPLLTRFAVPGAQLVEMTNETAYPDWLAERWLLGVGFVVVEHDVVPWPGAINDLLLCERPWCGFSYETGVHHRVPTFGCVKLGAELIAATPDAFSMARWHTERFPRDWRYCDQQLALVAEGFEWHQHFPAVVHVRGLV